MIVVGIVLFVLVDVALIAFALSTRAPTERAGDRPGAATVPPTPTPSIVPSETPAPPAATVAVPDRIIAALDGNTAYRAVTGSCPGAGASIEVTTDGGDSWFAADASNGGSFSTVQAIMPMNADEATALTLSTNDCAPRMLASYVTGDAWAETPALLATSIYLDPATRSSLHNGEGAIPAPCTVAVFAPRTDAEAAVLCSDQAVFTTSDSGASWAGPLEVPGAAHVATNGNGYVIALAGQGGCVVAVASLTQSLEVGTQAACVPTSATPGTFAVSGTNEGVIWIWADDTLIKSPDGGFSWS